MACLMPCDAFYIYKTNEEQSEAYKAGAHLSKVTGEERQLILHSTRTKVTMHFVSSQPIYVKLIYPRMKITVDNSEGRVQVVCH